MKDRSEGNGRSERREGEEKNGKPRLKNSQAYEHLERSGHWHSPLVQTTAFRITIDQTKMGKRKTFKKIKRKKLINVKKKKKMNKNARIVRPRVEKSSERERERENETEWECISVWMGERDCAIKFCGRVQNFPRRATIPREDSHRLGAGWPRGHLAVRDET